MIPSSCTCYVYYRVSADARDAAADAVNDLLRSVAAATGVSGHAAERVEGDSARALTWMEIYSPIDDREAFTSILTREASRHRVTEFLAQDSVRTLEWFAPLARRN